MKFILALTIFTLAVLSNAHPFGIDTTCLFKKCHNLPTAPNVDVNQYAGYWYEIARLPMNGENGCDCVQAHYTLGSDNLITVNNTCRRDAPTTPVSFIAGSAWQTDVSSKLEVQFFWPLSSDYWILQVASDYSYAMVGEPSLEFLWILSRTPSLDDSIISSLTSYAVSLGYNLSELHYTEQALCQGQNYPEGPVY